MEQIEEAAQHQTRSDQQHAGQAYLAINEYVAQAAVMTPLPVAVRPPSCRPLLGIGARGLHRGGQAKQMPVDSADEKREQRTPER